ncbi:MAG: PAS domain S-box protein [Holophagales bacterium]|nr:PAS domain S-box protein [Holophagales bacterium]
MAPTGPPLPGLVIGENYAVAAFEALPEGVVLHLASGEIVICNPAAERILGLTRSQMAGRTSLDPSWQAIREDGSPFPGETHPAMVTLRTGEPLRDVVMGLRKPDGAACWISVSSEPLPGPNGSIRAVVTTFVDITDRHLETAELAAQRDGFQRAIDNSTEAIFVTDRSGKVVGASPAACRMFGRSKEEMCRIGRAGLVDPNDPRLPAALAERELTGTFRGELDYVRADGSVFPGEVVSTIVTDPSGARWITANIRDVSERKRAEERFTAFFELSSVGKSMTAPDGRLIRVNKALCAFLGYSAEELQSRTIATVTHPDDLAETAELIRALLAGERDIVDVEKRYVTRDGRVVWARVRTCLLRDPLGAPLHLMTDLLDITDRKAAEKALEEATETLRVRAGELESANEALGRAARLKDEFLASMSHELRTPLSGVLGMAEVLRSGRSGPLNERQQRSLQVIEEGGRHLLSLINDILDVMKIEAGHVVLQPEPCSVAGVCRASISMIQAAADRKRIGLTVDVDPNASRVMADARRLHQVLFNLVSNAVKFTPAGGRVALEARVDPERGEIRFVVSDTGPGIAREDLGKLFKPFTQLDTRLAREHTGTGLGLALVRQLAELHGGSVEVESEPGRGSRFHVVLPWAPNAGPSHPSARPTAAETDRRGPVPPARGAVVLLIDDDPAAAEVLATYLGSSGIRLAVATSGMQGLDLATTLRPDVILLDIQLPGMDGLEVLRQLRAEGGDGGPRVIALTALAMSGDRERILAAGADEYLTKPVVLETLEARIRELAGA